MHKRPKYRPLRFILVVLNIVVAIGLACTLLAGVISPSLFPFFGVFGLLYPPLLLINLFFVIVWLLLKSKYMLISFIIILLGYGTLTENFQISFSHNAHKDTTDIKVLTYNVQRFGLDVSRVESEKAKQNILQFISSESPDIVCMQEYYGKGRTLYEPLMEMKSNLHAGAYYYESYFSPRFQQLTGLVIFSKYNAVNKGKLKFEGSRTFGIYTDLIINDDTTRVFNIHLASIQLMPSDIDFVVNPGQDENKKFRIHALQIYSKLAEAFDLRERQMTFLLSQINSSPYPVILAGDFNDTPASFVYYKITKKLNDTFVCKGNGFSITYAGKIPFLRIDYIMKNEAFKTLNYKRHKLDYSDHYPATATLSFN